MSRAQYLRWLPAILLMSVIAFISHQPDPVAVLAPFMKIARLGKVVVSVPDYVAHFTEYFILTLAIAYALRQQQRDRSTHNVFAVLVIVAVFALSDEFHQAFIPRRSPDIYDLGVDMLGAVSALIVLSLRRLINHLLVINVSGTRDPT